MQEEDRFTVGKFWLGKETGRKNWYIYWREPGKRNIPRTSTGTDDFQLAVEAITAHHLASIKTDQKEGSQITLRQILMKYWLDHGQTTVNAHNNKASLGYFNNFIDHCEDKGILPQNPTLEDWTPGLIPAFIQYLKDNPTHTEKKVFDPKDVKRVIDVVRTPRNRSNDTINRIMDDVRAAFNHAVDNHLTAWAPKFKHLPKDRDELDARKPMLSLDQMADLFVYAFSDPAKYHLQAYLMAAVSTLARPEAILDLSTSPEREQVDFNRRLIHLNPKGRTQTKKYRPVLPLSDRLLPWLSACEAMRKDTNERANGFLVEYKGKQLSAIRMTWNRAKTALGWPMVRDWDAKMIRHTVATWLRANKSKYGIDKEDIKMQLGHHRPDVTDIYAIHEPDYMDNIQVGIEAFFKLLEKKVRSRCSHIALTPGNVVHFPKQKKQVSSRG